VGGGSERVRREAVREREEMSGMSLLQFWPVLGDPVVDSCLAFRTGHR
jgi:hypothetical protein